MPPHTMPSAQPPVGDPVGRYVLRKLPPITALFWVIKIVAVTLGEAGSDEFAIELQFGYLGCALAFLVLFLVSVTVQIRARRFVPGVFWLVILATSICGTAISDLMDRGVGASSSVTASGIGYGAGALILVSILAVVFVFWWRTGQTYDVERIATRKGEVLYWLAILVSNTLGTASGDWLSDDTDLGFRNAFLIVAAVMLLLLAAHFFTPLNGTLLFWVAFVLTRPLSAAAGDSLTKPVDEGGLGLGTQWGSIVLLVVLVGLVAFQTWRIRTRPLDLLPEPTHRATGATQVPNGGVVLAHGRQPHQIVNPAAASSVDR